MRFHQLPPLAGMEGVRIEASFILSDIGLGASSATSAAFTNAFLDPSVSTTKSYLGVLVDPTLDKYTTTLNITSVASTTCLPLMAYAPRLSSLLRNFERFRVKYLRLDTTSRVSTEERGNFGFAYASDPWKCVEAYGDNATSDTFSFIRNMDNFQSCVAWEPKHSFVAIDERSRRTVPSDLLYTLNGITGNATYNMGDTTPRSTSQGVILAAQDRGSNVDPTQTGMRHTRVHIWIDAYEMSLAEPISGLRLTRQVDAPSYSLLRTPAPIEEVKAEHKDGLRDPPPFPPIRRRGSLDDYDQIDTAREFKGVDYAPSSSVRSMQSRQASTPRL